MTEPPERQVPGFRGNSVQPREGLRSVGDVVRRLEALSAQLPIGDGVRAFNEMYLTTTREVNAGLGAGRFGDPAYVTKLDVTFASLYLESLERHLAEPGSAPACWDVLFHNRRRRDVGALQFAIAGMNAHINYDLARALVICATESGTELGSDGVWRSDFLIVNEILAVTFPKAKQALASGPFAVADAVLGDEDDRVALWGIEQAREFAWTTALTLQTLSGVGLDDELLERLDGLVAMSSGLLLGVRV